MIKLNFLVEHLGNSQLAYYLTRELNKLSDERPDVDPIVFYNTITKPTMICKFAKMQMVQAWGQEGHTIATSCATARKMLTFPSPTKKYLYVWDLEWLRGEHRHYNMFTDVYHHPEIQLIARNVWHASVIHDVFNIDKIEVVEDFDYVRLLEVI
jgi:hypothetical protein